MLLAAPNRASADAVSDRAVVAEPVQQALAVNYENHPGWHERSLAVGRQERWYRVYVPGEPVRGAPMVVVLHGGTQSMRHIFRPGAAGGRTWEEIAERERVLLLAPNGTNPDTGDARGDYQTWNDLRTEGAQRNPEAEDVAFIVGLLDWAAATFGADRRRAYVAGESNGGMMAYRLLIEVPERFAAGAAFIANLPAGSRLVQTPARPTPLLIMNGTRDRVVRWDGGPVARNRGRVISTDATIAWWLEANRAAGPPTVETLPDGDPADGCRIARASWTAAPGGAPVVLYTMNGGGHAVPSRAHEPPENLLARRALGPICRDAEGAEIAWQFFAPHRR
jgi:polyhydroxybutyrate depolymerase